jgi:hypothetical protein
VNPFFRGTEKKIQRGKSSINPESKVRKMREYQKIQQKIIEKLKISILKEEKCIKDALKLIP